MGAALAALFLMRARARSEQPVRRAESRSLGRLIGTIQVASVVGLAWMMCTVGGSSPFAFEGGFLVVAVLTAVLMSTLVVHPFSAPARLASCRWRIDVLSDFGGNRTGFIGSRFFDFSINVTVGNGGSDTTPPQ